MTYELTYCRLKDFGDVASSYINITYDIFEVDIPTQDPIPRSVDLGILKL